MGSEIGRIGAVTEGDLVVYPTREPTGFFEPMVQKSHYGVHY